MGDMADTQCTGYGDSMKIVLSPGGSARREVELDEIQVPNLWHIAQALRTVAIKDPEASDMVLETWHLAHDLKANLRYMEGLLEALESLMDLEGVEPSTSPLQSYRDPDAQAEAERVWQQAFDAIAKAKGGA
jgi:hypothetical protein